MLQKNNKNNFTKKFLLKEPITAKHSGCIFSNFCSLFSVVALLSQNKPSSQSSNYPHGTSPTADKGNDGNTDGNFNSGSCIHTLEDGQYAPWWQVDLLKTASISKVRVYNRNDCCGGNFQNVDITTKSDNKGWVLFGHIITMGGTSMREITTDKEIFGRYLRVTQKTTKELHICEVMVFGYYL